MLFGVKGFFEDLIEIMVFLAVGDSFRRGLYIFYVLGYIFFVWFLNMELILLGVKMCYKVVINECDFGISI